MATSIVQPKLSIKASPRKLGSAGWRLSDSDNGHSSSRSHHPAGKEKRELSVYEGLMYGKVEDDLLELEIYTLRQERLERESIEADIVELELWTLKHDRRRAKRSKKN